MLPPINGYVLAGGESSRMQTGTGPHIDKALLYLREVTLLERALQSVAEVCGNATILCGPPDRCARLNGYGPTVSDTAMACGPLAGLAAALHHAREDWLLIVPVDLPLLPVSALRELAHAATENGGPSVAIMSARGGYQPLPVVLHRSARPFVDEALQRGDRKLIPVLRDAAEALCPLGIHVVPALELTGAAHGNLWFTNVNTPYDLRLAEEVEMGSNDFGRRASE